jgi:hypothetical protein
MGEVSNDAPGGEENKSTKLEQEIRSGEVWLIRITFASVVVNLIIASIYYGQLIQMRKATKAAQDAARAAQVASCVASDTLKSNKEQFKIEERPYATIEYAKFDSPLEQAHSPALIKLGFRNSGRTPALQTTFDLDAFVAGVRIKQIPRDFSAAFVIPPDRVNETSMNIWINKPGDFEGIRDGTRRLVLKGTIHYTDIFNEWHPTAFCAVYDSLVNKGWVFCPGNDVK